MCAFQRTRSRVKWTCHRRERSDERYHFAGPGSLARAYAFVCGVVVVSINEITRNRLSLVPVHDFIFFERYNILKDMKWKISFVFKRDLNHRADSCSPCKRLSVRTFFMHFEAMVVVIASGACPSPVVSEDYRPP